MPNLVRYLINDNGQPFDSSELQIISADLDRLEDDKRLAYRNENAKEIAQHSSSKLLIVSGPGTGKSTLFKQRIGHWLSLDSSASILALSFVRKLVADLHNDIKQDNRLSDEQKEKVDVHTLHKYARSITEQNHGSSEIRFKPHFRIITDFWFDVIWEDVLRLAEQTDKSQFAHKKFKEQLHNLNFDESVEWQTVRSVYFKLSKFYNAVGFADLILHAQKALSENSSIVVHKFFIVDEYQDFNIAEENFIKQLTGDGSGILMVGDDDQILYEKLKSGKAELIRALYKDMSFVNAMLPFCSRSTYHIIKTAEHFIKQSIDENSIEKIYLPISIAQSQKVQVIGCATASTSVDYINKFIEENAREIEKRKNDLNEGLEKDPFLLILTPAREVNFYASRGAKENLFGLIDKYKPISKRFSDDYYKVLNYFSLANHPENNFSFRKVLYYENIGFDKVNSLIKTCLEGNNNFHELDDKVIQSALSKCNVVKAILESESDIQTKVQKLSTKINIVNTKALKIDFSKQSITINQIAQVEHQEEESAELEELEVKPIAAVDLLTLVGSKGLSADHVMIIGFDNVNMSWVTRNSFFVAMTRARKSLHIITALGAGGSQKHHEFLNILPEDNIEFHKYTKSYRSTTPFRNKIEFIRYINSLTFNKYRRKPS